MQSNLNTGGARRDRTADLLHAMQALSQLSYGPTWRRGTLPDRGAIRQENERTTAAHALAACRQPGIAIRPFPESPKWHRWAARQFRRKPPSGWAAQVCRATPRSRPRRALMISWMAGADQCLEPRSSRLPAASSGKHVRGDVLAHRLLIIACRRHERRTRCCAPSRAPSSRARAARARSARVGIVGGSMPSRSRCQRSTGTTLAGGERIMCC